jgi:hypothetical protein
MKPSSASITHFHFSVVIVPHADQQAATRCRPLALSWRQCFGVCPPCARSGRSLKIGFWPWLPRTCTSQQCAELFSLSSSRSKDASDGIETEFLRADPTEFLRANPTSELSRGQDPTKNSPVTRSIETVGPPLPILSGFALLPRPDMVSSRYRVS